MLMMNSVNIIKMEKKIFLIGDSIIDSITYDLVSREELKNLTLFRWQNRVVIFGDLVQENVI